MPKGGKYGRPESVGFFDKSLRIMLALHPAE
jgi:hypothetical protein